MKILRHLQSVLIVLLLFTLVYVFTLYRESQATLASMIPALERMRNTLAESRDDLKEMKLAYEESQRELEAVRKELEEERSFTASLLSESGWNVASGQVTAYCPFDNVDGQQAQGDPRVTSTGAKTGRGVVAVDPKRIPYGSEIIIRYSDGTIETGVANDTGGALRSADGLVIDVFRETYQQASRHGRREATIFWKPPEGEER